MPLRCLLADRPIALASVASSRCPHSHSPPRFPARLGRRSVPPNHTGNGCEEEGKPRVARVVTEVPPQVRRIWGREREREGAASVVGRGEKAGAGRPAHQQRNRRAERWERERERRNADARGRRLVRAPAPARAGRSTPEWEGGDGEMGRGVRRPSPHPSVRSCVGSSVMLSARTRLSSDRRHRWLEGGGSSPVFGERRCAGVGTARAGWRGQQWEWRRRRRMGMLRGVFMRITGVPRTHVTRAFVHMTVQRGYGRERRGIWKDDEKGKGWHGYMRRRSLDDGPPRSFDERAKPLSLATFSRFRLRDTGHINGWERACRQQRDGGTAAYKRRIRISASTGGVGLPPNARAPLLRLLAPAPSRAGRPGGSLVHARERGRGRECTTVHSRPIHCDGVRRTERSSSSPGRASGVEVDGKQDSDRDSSARRAPLCRRVITPPRTSGGAREDAGVNPLDLSPSSRPSSPSLRVLGPTCAPCSPSVLALVRRLGLAWQWKWEQ
ncbi:hypothetical protein DFH06DRAFT_1123899 [Mycena polygramma]|nr:hypothetical protein DFH06DRAFT_1123899 [Mycena polygramma]